MRTKKSEVRYGDNGPLRAHLEDHGIRYVMAVSRSHHIPAGAGKTTRADALAARLPRHAWQKISAGRGAKGHRFYDWAWATITTDAPGCRWLLIRRNRRTRELACYRCWAPHPVPLTALVHVAGRRWTVEENFQATKGLAGLDEHQVRRWNSWHRWVTLAMAAAAFLTITAARERIRQPPPPGLIPLTRNETAHLLTTATPHRLAWSHWRRQHQHRAQQAHYQRQSNQDP